MENTGSRPYTNPSIPQTHSTRQALPARLYGGFKRGMDIFSALLGLVVLSPVLLIIAIWIQRDSPGPVFYRGPRLGRGGKLFSILKFRTMYERPESYAGPRLTAQDDARITHLGRWLRDTKLNELPQLWNVLVGDMSLVGPRPEDPELAQAWPAEVRDEILRVRPGITSPASVLYRDEESMLATGQLMSSYLGAILPSKQRLDQLYVRRRSLLLDLDTLLWTSLVLVPKIGAAVPPENRVFLGPLSRLMRRHVSWFGIDTAVTLIAIGLTGVFWRSFGPLDVGWPKAILLAVGFALLYSISNAILGVNRISWSQASLTDAMDLIPALGLATLAAIVVNVFWLANPLLPIGLIIMAALLASAGFVVVRYRSRLLSGLALRWMSRRNAIQAQERVIILGGGESGQFVAWLLQNGRTANAFQIIGFVDDDLYKQGIRIRGVNVVGQREDLPELVKRFDVGIIIFAIHNIPAIEKHRLLNICRSTSAQVVSFPDVVGNLHRVVDKKGYTANDQTDPGEEPSDSRPEAISLLGSEQIDTWLTELGELAQLGDLAAITMRIQDIRSQIQAETIQ